MLSVIIPVYNGEKYIVQSVLSAIHQKEVNVEVIVVNDGSTDNTRMILQSIWDKYSPNGRIIDIDNGGLANARNVGIKACHGEYILNLDADDYLEPGILKKAYTLVKQQDSDICYYGFEDIDENNVVIKEYSNSFEYHDYSNGLLAATDKLLRKIWICQGSAIYKKSLIFNYDVLNIKGVNQGEDLYFITTMLFVANKISCIHEVGVHIRTISTSMMHATYNESFMQNKIAAQNLKNKLIDLMRTNYDEELISIVDVQIMDQICCIAKKMIRSGSFNIISLIKRLNGLYDDEFNNIENLKAYMKKNKYYEYKVFRISRVLYIIFTRIHG